MWTLEEFNTLDAQAATDGLMACCAAPHWVQNVCESRPYVDISALRRTADDAFAALDARQIRVAVAAHPAIGTKAAGNDTESAWSRAEQGAALSAAGQVQHELAEANLAYQQRFGQVFLCRATGRSAAELLAEARRRLGNDPETEAAEVAAELRQIVGLRVEKLVTA